jgi:hypothetical protein
MPVVTMIWWPLTAISTSDGLRSGITFLANVVAASFLWSIVG